MVPCIYPEETEDLWMMEPQQGRVVGSSQGEPDISLAVWPVNESPCFGDFPADPVVGPPIIVRALDWDLVE